MSFPNILFGPEGEQFNTYDTASADFPNQRFPLGTLLVQRDGRCFRFAENGGTALVVARLIQGEVPNASWDELLIPTAVALNGKTIVVTNGTAVIVADEFTGGYLNIEDDAGEGYLYLIGSNSSAGNGAAITVNLAPGHSLQVAITTATTVGIWKNPFKDVIVHPSPATALLAGVTIKPLAANAGGWLQTGGIASVLIDAFRYY